MKDKDFKLTLSETKKVLNAFEKYCSDNPKDFNDTSFISIEIRKTNAYTLCCGGDVNKLRTMADSYDIIAIKWNDAEHPEHSYGEQLLFVYADNRVMSRKEYFYAKLHTLD